VTREEFEDVVADALDDLPEWVLEAIENVVILVEERANASQDPDGEGLFGIYEGVPLPDRGFDYSLVLPDRIMIFQESLERVFSDRDELKEEIRVTVLHEVAHHLGIEEDRLQELGWE
jgi:predicted Zn-dependent protease with MMP-like domain